MFLNYFELQGAIFFLGYLKSLTIDTMTVFGVTTTSKSWAAATKSNMAIKNYNPISGASKYFRYCCLPNYSLLSYIFSYSHNDKN